MGVSISLNVTQGRQYTASNSTDVSVRVTISWNYGSWNNHQCPGVVTVDGKNFDFSTNFNWNGANDSGSVVAWTGTVNVPHDDDGSKTVQCSAWFASGVSSGTVSTDTSKVLKKIPRASGLTEVKNVDFGSRCSVTWTPLSTSVYNKLKFSIGQWTGSTSIFCPGTASSYTYTGYVIPYEAASAIPNAIKGTMTVTLYSYSDSWGGTQIGAQSETFEVTLPSSVKPSIWNQSASIDNSINPTIDSWGMAVVGYTKAHISASSAGAYGSTVTRFTISGGYEEVIPGSTLNFTGKIISSSGSKSFTITCTDSRGRTSDPVTTNSIQFVRYVAPKISQFTASKNSQGNACLTAIFSFDPMQNHNSAEAVLYYRAAGASAPTWYRLGIMRSNQVFTTNIKPDEVTSYNFKVILTDALGNAVEKIAFLSTAKVLLDFKSGGDGFGVGKISEKPGMEVAMDATFFGNILIGTKPLAQYIQEIMKILPSDMYGTGDPPATAEIGQIYFKKLETRAADGVR